MFGFFLGDLLNHPTNFQTLPRTKSRLIAVLVDAISLIIIVCHYCCHDESIVIEILIVNVVAIIN